MKATFIALGLSLLVPLSSAQAEDLSEYVVMDNVFGRFDNMAQLLCENGMELPEGIKQRYKKFQPRFDVETLEKAMKLRKELVQKGLVQESLRFPDSALEFTQNYSQLYDNSPDFFKPSTHRFGCSVPSSESSPQSLNSQILEIIGTNHVLPFFKNDFAYQARKNSMLNQIYAHINEGTNARGQIDSSRKPQFIVLESFEALDGLMSCENIFEVLNLQETGSDKLIDGTGEFGYAYYHALKNNIPVMGAEPSVVDYQNALKQPAENFKNSRTLRLANGSEREITHLDLIYARLLGNYAPPKNVEMFEMQFVSLTRAQPNISFDKIFQNFEHWHQELFGSSLQSTSHLNYNIVLGTSRNDYPTYPILALDLEIRDASFRRAIAFGQKHFGATFALMGDAHRQNNQPHYEALSGALCPSERAVKPALADQPQNLPASAVQSTQEPGDSRAGK